jgi:hypothetical protein
VANNRWAEVKTTSNDKGPFKLLDVESDGSPQTAYVAEPYGFASNPAKGSIALLSTLDDDEGKSFGTIMPAPAKRLDGLKEGETAHYNPETQNIIKHDIDGHTTIELPGGTVVKHWKDGTIGVKPGGGQKVALGDVRPDGMARVMTEAGPSVNVYAKI